MAHSTMVSPVAEKLDKTTHTPSKEITQRSFRHFISRLCLLLKLFSMCFVFHA